MTDSKITALDRAAMNALRKEIDFALEAVGRKFGLSMHAGSGRYTPKNATFKLEIAVFGEDGEAVDAGAETFRAFASAYGLAPEDLGREFSVGGGVYRITGLNARRPKFPINGVRVPDGRPFKFPVETVKRALRPKGVSA